MAGHEMSYTKVSIHRHLAYTRFYSGVAKAHVADRMPLATGLHPA
jgi:hypothetical protein